MKHPTLPALCLLVLIAVFVVVPPKDGVSIGKKPQVFSQDSIRLERLMEENYFLDEKLKEDFLKDEKLAKRVRILNRQIKKLKKNLYD